MMEADKESGRKKTESTVPEKSVGLLQKLVSHLKCFREKEDETKDKPPSERLFARRLAPRFGQSLWVKSAPSKGKGWGVVLCFLPPLPFL